MVQNRETRGFIFFTVDLFVEFVLRQVGGQHRQLAESQQRLLLHKVARLHVGLAVERPVSLQRHKTPRQSQTHTKNCPLEQLGSLLMMAFTKRYIYIPFLPYSFPFFNTKIFFVK